MGWEAAGRYAAAKGELLQWAVAIVVGRAEANERQTDLAYRVVEANLEKPAPDGVSKPRARRAEKDPATPAASLKTTDDIYAKIASATGAAVAPSG